MILDLHDTIVALASPPGVGARAIVRLSGPDALTGALRLFTTATPVSPTRRRLYCGSINLPSLLSPLPADLAVWPSPRSYTGQTMAELHLLSAPPLVEQIVAELLRSGARAAQPGEFTLRAFLSGKLDLTRAEAVLDVIEAGSRDALKQALATLAGGLSQPLRRLRSELLDLLADLEAGLDFADEDLTFATPDELLRRFGHALAVLSHLEKQLDGRAQAGRPFRVVLAGRPNAGKTSLFNALTGADALVSAVPGTTRDYLVRRMNLDGVTVELIDTAGWQESNDGIDDQAQALGREQRDDADLVLHCIDAVEPTASPPTDARTVVIATRCDLAPAPPGRLGTSAATGAGLGALRRLLAERARARAEIAPAPSVSRCRHHVAACTEGLRRAHQMVLFGEPPELVALELRTALDHLGEMAGTVYTDDLLDRIFSRFCIGK